MKVFCPEHHKGFFTPRQSPIRCESRGHVLGELDFQGTSKAPAEIRWQYCCNCEHFCPIDFERHGLERCPVCTRRTSTLYLCDRCYVVSFESNTPLQTKNFTLSAEGSPQPSCPGCLEEPSADLREHDCADVELTFITALTSCPICQERLDVGPTFPATVAHYLRRTKAANKVNVTFDYDTEHFVPISDGEFVVIKQPQDGTQPIVLPRSPRFATKRDFYELYQDYYHCRSVSVGEVKIVEPATVLLTPQGWKLQAPGILEVEAEPSKTRKHLTSTGAGPLVEKHQQTTLPRAFEQQPTQQESLSQEKGSDRACGNCGALVEARYAFCWKCGNKMGPDDSGSNQVKKDERSIRRIVVKEDEPAGERDIDDIQQSILASVPSWRRFASDDDEATVQHDKARVRPSNSSANVLKHAPTTPASHSILKLIGMAVIGVLIASLGLSVLTRATSQPLVTEEIQPAAVVQVQSEPIATIETAEPTKEVLNKNTPQDDELRKLRAKSVSAVAADRSKILQAFAKTEKRFPNDYRFPYERAKLVAKATNRAARKDAFNALATAAERAIKSDKANEMLEGLETDKRGDFQKLAHSRREWNQVVEALKSKDTDLLAVNGR